MKRICTILTVMGVALVAATAAFATNQPEKITICHVAGLASDPANYVTLNLPPQAIFGNGGHFNENGTTQAGHEQDTFGECNPPEPPVDPPVNPEPPAERCPPGMFPTNGKDGEEGNDECEYPPTTPVTTTTPVSSPPPVVQTVFVDRIVEKIVFKTKVKVKKVKVFKTKVKKVFIVKVAKPDKPKTKTCKPGFAFSKKYGCTAKVEGSG